MIIHVCKALDPANSIMQKHLQNFQTPNVYSRKPKFVLIPFRAYAQKST